MVANEVEIFLAQKAREQLLYCEAQALEFLRRINNAHAQQKVKQVKEKFRLVHIAKNFEKLKQQRNLWVQGLN